MQRFAITSLVTTFLFLFAVPIQAAERQNLLSASGSIRQEYDSNVNLSDTNREENWYTVLSPGLSFTSLGPSDELLFSYELGFRKNQTTEVNDIDHDLFLRGDKSLSSRWHAGFSDRYYKSEDTEYLDAFTPPDAEEAYMPEAEADRSLSERLERHRFWTNTLSMQTDYTYAPESMVTLGYSNRVLDNQNGTADDYVRHNPTIGIGYQFDPAWHGDLSYGYIKGDFDQSDDLKEHSVDLQLSWLTSLHNTLTGSYRFARTDYQGPTDDYKLHSLLAGWERQLNPLTNFGASVGFTAIDKDIGDDDSAFSYSLDLTRELQRGSVALLGAGGIDETQFDGESDEELARYWSVRGVLHYALMERLTSSLDLSYRENDYIERATDTKEDVYRAGCGLTYAFARWYELSVRYVYRELDADRDSDDYQDHRLFLELRVTRDLFRW